MKKVYIVYTQYSDDCMLINNCDGNIELMKAFDNIDIASNYALDEAKWQCEDEQWHYAIEFDDDTTKHISIYYNEEWQYNIVVKKMVVE